MTRHVAFVGVETENEYPPYGDILAVHAFIDHEAFVPVEVELEKSGTVRNPHVVSEREHAIARIRDLLEGAQVVSVNASVDEAKLRLLLAEAGLDAPWYGRFRDAVDAGSALLRARVNSGELVDLVDLRSDREVSRAVGVAPPRHQDQHAARTRASWARDLWAAVNETSSDASNTGVTVTFGSETEKQ